MANEAREAITSQTNAANKILGIGAFDTDRYKRMESDWYTFVGAKGVMDDSDYVKARRDFETAYNRGYDAHESAITDREAVLVAALERLRDCDWVITLPDRMDAVREIAREALAKYRGER